jgi:serine protease Do
MGLRPRHSRSPVTPSPAFVTLCLGLMVVLAGCGAGSVFDAAASTATPSTAPASTSTTLLQATSTAAVTPITGVVLYDVSDLVKQVRPGVVSVTETGFTMDMFMRQVQTEGEGTGIVIDDQGHILTNYHVISGAETVSVYAEDGVERSATVIYGDPETDIALLEVANTSGLTPLTLGDSSLMEVGDPVIAMGNALGLDETSPTVSVGIVSAIGRTIETDQAVLEDLIQTDAAINSGNSGGPLLNAAGEVVGINTAIASNAENIGFSISIDSVKEEITQALSGTGVPYIGVSTLANSSELAQRYRLATAEGLIVTSVLPTGPASAAGLQAGDIIMSVNGTSVSTDAELDAAVAAAGSGQSLTLTIMRGRQTGDLSVVIAGR